MQKIFIEDLVKILKASLKVIQYQKIQKNMDSSSKLFLRIYNLLEKYSLEVVFPTETESIYKLSNKL